MKISTKNRSIFEFAVAYVIIILGISGLEVIKLEYILRLKIKRNDWLLADTCPQATNHCALFRRLISMYVSVMVCYISCVDPEGGGGSRTPLLEIDKNIEFLNKM